MRTIPLECNWHELPDLCAYVEYGEYHILQDGREVRLPAIEGMYVPFIEKYKEELGLEYDKEEWDGLDDQWIDYWNPRVFETEKVTMPVYLYRREKTFPFRFVGNKALQKLTRSTIEAAEELQKEVENHREKWDLEMAEIVALQNTLAELDGRPSGRVMVDIANINNGCWDHYHLNKGENNILLCKVYTLKGIDPIDWDLSNPRKDLFCWEKVWNYGIFLQDLVAFDLNSKDDVVLEVPSDQVGMYIGRKGWQVRRWSRLIGRKISVKGI